MMRRVLALFVVAGCTKAPPPVAPRPLVAAVRAAPQAPVRYRTIHHAVQTPGNDFLVVGQQRTPESTSEAFVALSTPGGELLWSWSGRGAWEAAHRVAYNAHGTVVVAGRSDRADGERVWLRGFDAEGRERWAIDTDNAAILAVGAWEHTAALLLAPYGTLDARLLVVDSVDGRATFEGRFARVLSDYDDLADGIPAVTPGFVFENSEMALRPQPDAPHEWSFDDDAELEAGTDGTTDHAASLEVVATAVGPLDTDRQIASELRWAMEAGVEWDWPSDDVATAKALRLLRYMPCEEATYEQGCGEDSTMPPPTYDEFPFSDPCHIETFATLLEGAAAPVLREVARDFVDELADLPFEHPLVDVIFEHADAPGVLRVMNAALAQPDLHDTIVWLADAHPDEAQAFEAELREARMECRLVRALRSGLLDNARTVPPFPERFDDACEQLYAMCVEEQSDELVLPPGGRFRVETSCGADFPDDPEVIGPCRDGTSFSDEVPEVSSPDALDRCSASEISPDLWSPEGNCGVLERVESETISFRQRRNGRWVIDRVEVDIDLEAP